MRELISVSEAKDIIATHTHSLAPRILPLNKTSGLVLSSPILAQSDVPPFNQSSMDGYAINFEDYQSGKQLISEGQSAAGPSGMTSIQPGQALRIFTGAAVPEGADTIVMQEKTTVSGGFLTINDPGLAKGQNFRPKGIEIRKGTTALEAGSVMTPAAIGFVAGMGVDSASVYVAPRVAVILTGDELCPPGNVLHYGQVYEANSFALRAALEDIGVSDINLYYAEDNLPVLSATFAMALENNDLVILTGGVSVGDYDFVIRAAAENEVEGLFHKVRQKPGKPLFFGSKNAKLVFGLPGNPASVLSCFYQYVQPCIGQIMKRDRRLTVLEAPLTTSLKKPAGLTQFLKGFYDGQSVSDLQAQESFRLSSFAMANCLIELSSDRENYTAGERVDIHLLPNLTRG